MKRWQKDGGRKIGICPLFFCHQLFVAIPRPDVGSGNFFDCVRGADLDYYGVSGWERPGESQQTGYCLH